VLASLTLTYVNKTGRRFVQGRIIRECALFIVIVALHLHALLPFFLVSFTSESAQLARYKLLYHYYWPA